MAKHDKLIWLRVDEDMHSKVTSIAGKEFRTVQGQYRHFFELGMDAWQQKIATELLQQLEANRKANPRKKLLRGDMRESERRRA